MDIIYKNSKINKLQQGGGFAFVGVNPVDNVTPTSSGNEISTKETKEDKESKKKGVGLLTDDMLKKIYETGLISDTMEFVKDLDAFMTTPTSNNLFGGVDNATQQYKALLTGLVRLRVGSEEYKKARDTAIANESLSEVAVSQRGTYFILNNKGKVQEVSSITNEDRVLTNEDMLQLRMNKMAFNDDISGIVLQSVSTKNINKKVEDSLKTIGSSEFKNTYFKNYEGNIEDGVKQIINGGQMGQSPLYEDGIYKVTTENKSNVENVSLATKYLLSTLTTNEKALLRAKGIQSGLNPEDGDITSQMIVNIMQSKFKTTNNTNIDKQKPTKSESDGSDKDKLKVTPSIMYHEGTHQSYDDLLKLNPGGTNTSLKVSAQIWDNPIGNDNESLGVRTLSDFIDKALPGAARRSGIYMGGNKIDHTMLNKVMVDASEIARTELPVDTSGNPLLSDEYIKEWTELSQKLSYADSAEERLELVNQSRFRGTMKEDGSFDNRYVRPFIMVQGYTGRTDNWMPWNADTGLLVKPENDKLLYDIKSSTDKNYKLYKNLLDDNDIPSEVISGGNIFIPLTQSSSSAIVGSGQAPTVKDKGYRDHETLQKKELIRDKRIAASNLVTSKNLLK